MYEASVWLRIDKDTHSSPVEIIKNERLSSVLDELITKYPRLQHKSGNSYFQELVNEVGEIEKHLIALTNKRVIITPIVTVDLNGWLNIV